MKTLVFIFSLSGLCHGCHSFLTPVCPPLLSHRPISFSVGWSCLFTEVCLCGEGIPRCSGPPLVFQLITRNMTALPLFGAEMSCFSRYRREQNFSANVSPSPTSLQVSGSIPYARANTVCFRISVRTLCNFAPSALRFGTGSVRRRVSLSCLFCVFCSDSGFSIQPEKGRNP